MPLLEKDVIFAYINQSDSNHTTIEKFFQNLTAKLQLKLPKSVLLKCS